jgi:hypothetical protein
MKDDISYFTSSHKMRTMTPVIGIYRLGLLALLPFSVYSNQPCERLKATLTYTQEEAPRDLSSVVRQHVVHGCHADIIIQSS